MAVRRVRRSIRMQLFSSYSILLIATLLAFGLFSWIYTARVLSARTSASLQTLTASLLERLNQEVHEMDDMSLSVAYAYLKDSQLESNRSLSENHLPEMLGSILGPFQTVQQLYVHTYDGPTTGVGLVSGVVPGARGVPPWIAGAEAREGKMFISLPHGDPQIERQIPIYRDRRYVSLARVIYDQFRKPLGVVEVEQDVHALFGDFGPQRTDAPDVAVTVTDASGGVLYDGRAVSAPVGGRRRFVSASTQSSYSDLTVTALEPRNLVVAPISTLTRFLLTAAIIAILVTLLLSYFVARRLTIPIRKVHDAIAELDSERLFAGRSEPLGSELNELEQLNVAFNRMHITLRDSVSDLIKLRSHEALTRMLALQTQIRPHFLYNTLANISVMAEEGMNDRIVQLCTDLSAMYRYLGEGISDLTTLDEELAFTQSFLACMAYRLDDGVDYRCEIADALRDLRIPKLSVQPLVENVLKYGVRTGARVEIRVTGKSSGGRWRIAVHDNGPGFSEAARAALREKFQVVEGGGETEHDGNDNLGITNVYARLRILYGVDALLTIGATSEGGAEVTIGGLVRERAAV